jgi:hypothetical protein
MTRLPTATTKHPYWPHLTQTLPNYAPFHVFVAGALCSRLGRCSRDLGAECALKATDAQDQQLQGTLSMCTAEGVSTGQGLPGILTSFGEPAATAGLYMVVCPSCVLTH